VGGVTYNEENSVILQESKDTSNPVSASFDLPDMAEAVTFRNTGEQQCVIVSLEYFLDDDMGVALIGSDSIPLRIEYFNLSGERVLSPADGIFIMRALMPDGKTITRKIVR